MVGVLSLNASLALAQTRKSEVLVAGGEEFDSQLLTVELHDQRVSKTLAQKTVFFVPPVMALVNGESTDSELCWGNVPKLLHERSAVEVRERTRAARERAMQVIEENSTGKTVSEQRNERDRLERLMNESGAIVIPAGRVAPIKWGVDSLVGNQPSLQTRVILGDAARRVMGIGICDLR